MRKTWGVVIVIFCICHLCDTNQNKEGDNDI
jgi:hypothetical protein